MDASESIRSLLIHALLRMLILAGFAFFIVHLVQNDTLSLYIAPRMAPYVKLSALMLYAAASYQLYLAFQLWMGQKQEISCDCNHHPARSLTKNIIIYSLFIFPLALGFLLPDTLMGSTLAAKKGMSLNGSLNVSRPEAVSADTASEVVKPADAALLTDAPTLSDKGEPPVPQLPRQDPLDALFPADIYTESYARYGKQLYGQDQILVEEKQFIETLTTLDLYREQYIGKQIEISGFVYKESAMAPDQLVISRFAMNCCSADSLPYGLLVSHADAAAYPPDTWLRITGELQLSTYNGYEVITIKAARLEPIEAPESPYVYPDYDFGL